ncbi:hypothetical protein BDR07DRAFT_1568823 [Suillus spraguei]|nr:hypothetical protein BDR07DRAFT_1568823 [Suillus spraguei]
MYQNVYLGTGTGFNTNIVPGPNNITLNGILVPRRRLPTLRTVLIAFHQLYQFRKFACHCSGQVNTAA